MPLFLTSNFLFLGKFSILHGLMAKSTAPSTAVATRTAAQTWHFFTEVVKFHESSPSAWPAWPEVSWASDCMECITKMVGWKNNSIRWLEPWNPGRDRDPPWRWVSGTSNNGVRFPVLRCWDVGSIWFLDFRPTGTWIIDYVTIINPQRNVERWICRHASGSKTSMGDIVLLGSEGGCWKGDFSFMFLFRNTSDGNICWMSHIVWDSNAFLN